MRQQHLRRVQPILAEAGFVHLHQPHLADGSCGLQLTDRSWPLLPTQALHALGYGAARLFKLPVPSRRTTAIEVGMQNSGLAAGLARQYLTPESALPGAIFSVWHNVSGAVLAAYWRRRSTPASRAGEPAPVAVTE